ncbi:transposase [Streptomyces sp. NPDC088560]|uniref:transposase n=1 Tax=Streptomyces sp. NPDC088560 TaxID=3365868 RepID=UPI00380E25B7
MGGLRGPVRRPLLQSGPAARVSRVPDGAAGAAGAEQDDHLPGRGGTCGRCQDAGGAAAAVLPVRVAPRGRAGQRPAVELLREESATAPHDGGVIVIDGSGYRKDGTATAHVGRQWLGRYGKTDSGIVTMTMVWTDGRVYYPLHATPYTPAHRFARGCSVPAFRTKTQLAAALAARGRRRASAAGRWSPTAPTEVSDDWYLALREAGLAQWSRSSRTAAPGLRPTSRIPLSKPPMPWLCTMPAVQAPGHPRSVTSATGTP